MTNRIIIWLLFLLLTNGCSQKESVVAPQIASLLGTWQLIEPDSSYAVTLNIAYDTANPPHDVTPFKATGKSSVNDYSVNLFATLDGMLSADELGSTKKAGPPEAMIVEQTYFTNLKAAVQYKIITNNQLRITHGGSQPHVLVYKRLN